MSGTVREVSAPTPPSAEHTMSPEGAARLARLSPEERSIAPDGQERSTTRAEGHEDTLGRFPTREEADRAREAHNRKMVEDADGGTANTETGEYTPPARPDQPQADAPVDISVIPELAVPQTLAP